MARPARTASGRIESSDDLMYMGRYALFVCVFVEFSMFSQLANTLYMVFARTPPVVTSCGGSTFVDKLDFCQRIDECNGSVLQMQRQFKGIIEEFGLHCEGEKLERLGTSMQMVGLMLGSVSFGYFADQYGRKTVSFLKFSVCLTHQPMFICVMATILLGYLSTTAPNFWLFTAYRTVLGFFNGGQSAISVVYMLENVPKNARMYLSTLISYSPNVAILGVVAWVFPNWEFLAAVISLLTAPAVVMLIWLEESPRWLMQKRRPKEAHAVFTKMLRFDKRSDVISSGELMRLLEDECRKNPDEGKQGSCSAFRNRRIVVGALVISFCFFSTTAINYANMFNLGAISGSMFLNALLIGLLRYAFSIAYGILDVNFPGLTRKRGHSVCDGLSMCSLTAAFLFLTFGSELSSTATIVRICVLVSCAVTSQTIIVASVTCNELIPTEVRAQVFSLALLSSRFAIVFSPHFFVENSVTRAYPNAPYVLLLLLAVLDLVFFRTLIPETKNKRLEDHVQGKPSTADVEMLLVAPKNASG